ncbi:MAG TPA: energy transducer TonB [Candidatus Polarisedimenticolaceae bacterium]|nr:energy transducer TonB [Candidatus Polarisedimenticolaceae bacterium]
MRCENAGWAFAGLLLTPTVLCAQTAGGAPPAPSCDRFAVAGVMLGMTSDEVHKKLGSDEGLVTDEGAGATRKTAIAYRSSHAVVYVRYDRALGSRGAARVEMVRAPLPQTLTAVNGLITRLGEPSAGSDFLVRGLDQGPAVWIDERCNLVLTYHRRQESWWADDVGAFLQLETLEDVRAGGSPATAAVAAYQADGHPVEKAPAAPFPVQAPAPESPASPAASAASAVGAPDRAAQRVEYVPPVYPSTARMLRLKGRVTLKLRVRGNGAVADATVVEAQPAGKGFERAATEAARQWHYLPAIRDGLPVESEVLVVLDFR